MDRLVNIQTDLKPLKQSEKFEINFYDHLWTSWIIENDEPARPRPTRPWCYLTVIFSEIIRDKDVKFSRNLHSSLEFMLQKFGIDICDSFEIMLFSAT